MMFEDEKERYYFYNKTPIGFFLTKWKHNKVKSPGHFLLIKLDGSVVEPDGGYNKQS